MPDWNADQYLKFAEERTQPCRDLVGRIAVLNVRRVIDLGCGPGNSTGVLAERWPEAAITGLDNSVSMLDIARKEQPQHRWIAEDITEWASQDAGEAFDIVFSNAALQWAPDHTSLYLKLLARVASGGAFAAQVPADINAPQHRLMREIAPNADAVRQWHSHPPAFYYDLLAPHCGRVDVWEIEYQHVLPNPEAIVEWYKGTGMRPFLEALKSDSERETFLNEYLTQLRSYFPFRADGRVLLPFRRLFVIAYRHG